jgi:mannose-6-phosphate isomerase-like protein (cupin superfamily)
LIIWIVRLDTVDFTDLSVSIGNSPGIPAPSSDQTPTTGTGMATIRELMATGVLSYPRSAAPPHGGYSVDNFRNLYKTLEAVQIDANTVSEPIKRMSLFDGDNLTANMASTTDMGNSLHAQPAHEEILFVLEGEADFRVGEETRRVGAGDIIFIPRDTLHGRVRTLSKKWTALSIYGPAFDPSNKKNIRWDRDAPAA